jgi:SAM-dependent methyltransferase
VRTRISDLNPYGYTRHGYLWETLHNHPSQNHLDYGAHDGSVIRVLVETGCVDSATGVDVNREVVKGNASGMPPGVDLRSIVRCQPLPFPDHTFETASLLDVIEHVAEQEAVLREIHRVLRPTGRLIITVPGKHLFSFLDTGNLKFRFPRLHRRLYLQRHSLEEYERRYVNNPDGLIGDIEREKAWHQHFSHKELRLLLEDSGFHVVEKDGSGFFSRLFLPLRLISPGFLSSSWDRLLRLDARLFASTNLFCIAEKSSE